MDVLKNWKLGLLIVVASSLLACAPPNRPDAPPRPGNNGGNVDVAVPTAVPTAMPAETATEAAIAPTELPATAAAEEAVVEAEAEVIEPTAEPVVEEAVSDLSVSPVNLSDCPADTFLDVTTHPQNTHLAAPELSVTCQNGQMTIVSNSMPSFEYVMTFPPGDPSAQSIQYSLPMQPQFAASPTDVPLGGPTAIAVDGVLIFGPTEGNGEDPYLNDILDYCNGHIDPGRGAYHFHARPDCLFENLDGQVGLVVAWAFDGFPILAPYLCEDAACTSVKEVQSGWVEVNPNESDAWERFAYVDGESELDECNGMLFDDGSYAYFATDTFPYFMGCYQAEMINTRP